ncbi:hypothetical protein ACFB49_34040 [Sphingomonas sp. DBB INV C78]
MLRRLRVAGRGIQTFDLVAVGRVRRHVPDAKRLAKILRRQGFRAMLMGKDVDVGVRAAQGVGLVRGTHPDQTALPFRRYVMPVDRRWRFAWKQQDGMARDTAAGKNKTKNAQCQYTHSAPPSIVLTSKVNAIGFRQLIATASTSYLSRNDVE